MAAPQPARQKKTRKAETIKYLTEDEISRFFGVITNPRDLAMFRMAYHRGLRAREIGMIQLQDLQKNDRIRFSRLKGSNGGEYHLSSSELRALKQYLKVRGHEPGPLFQSRLGTPISQQMLDVLMKRYCQAAGIPREKAHTHALKHSCGTHLLNRGESIEDVQDHLGHVNIQVTLKYAKFTNQRRQARDKRLRDW